jgi:hypothetical protein
VEFMVVFVRATVPLRGGPEGTGESECLTTVQTEEEGGGEGGFADEEEEYEKVPDDLVELPAEEQVGGLLV